MNNNRSMEIDEDEFIEQDDDDEMNLPKVSNWIDSDGTTVIHGVEVIKEETDTCGFDVCSICLTPWNSHGKHRICSLPCGHIYGMSCIKKWLLHHKSSRKCPQCNTSCRFKDIRLLYATHLCLSHHKEPSTTRYPFTRQGFNAFQTYLIQRTADTVRLQEDVFNQMSPESKNRAQLSKQQQRNYALDWRADALERRWHALGRLLDSYNRSKIFVMQEYREHRIKAKNNTNTN